MAKKYDIKGMAEKVEVLKQEANNLKKMSGGMPAVDLNVDRILANVKMLEINVVDVARVVGK
jgi:hypothetical protein